MAESRASQLHFDPDLHPDDTLKAFNEFIQDFELRYDATNPDPPKVSLDSALERWKLAHEYKKPTLEEYDEIVEEWKSHDRVAKFLGIYSSRRLYSDWQAAQPAEKLRKNAKWPTFIKIMQDYYKPTENPTLKNFQFRSISQEKNESFISFCNRVEKEAKHCHFKCDSDDCTAEVTAVRDQIVIGTISDQIREEALKKSWTLADLRKEGMHMESASKGASEIAGDTCLNKLGKYSFKNRKKEFQGTPKKVNCYFCGLATERRDIAAHSRKCPARNATCSKCKKIGHNANVCKSEKTVQEVTYEDDDDENDPKVLNINLFCLKKRDENSFQDVENEDFKVQLVINNHLDTVLADTGAKVSVCGVSQAQKWGLLDRMTDTNIRIKPYKSQVIPAIGESRCSVTFGDRSVPVLWYIIKETCEPVLSGNKARQLGIIKFQPSPDTFTPVNMIELEDKQGIQNVLTSYPHTFQGIGKLKDYQVKLHLDHNLKPIAEPPRRIPYNLKSRVDESLANMLESDVIEEHPNGEPAPWVSNIVIAPKDDDEIRITLDAKNVNKAIMSSNFPIPRQEDIKAKLTGSKVFSKLDLKSAFWQLEMAPESRYLTVFHANGKLYRYKRLVMGLKPAQGELNAALQPLFAHIPQVHVIHDDLIIGTATEREHEDVVEQVMQIISAAGLTLNPKKCVFGKHEIKFWGLIVSADGVRPDPEKVEALDHISPPTTKEELNSFLCMMQSNFQIHTKFCKESIQTQGTYKERSKIQVEKRASIMLPRSC